MIDSRDEKWLAAYQKEKARIDALPRRKWRKESEVYAAKGISAIKKAHPHLQAKETYALGHAGYGPDHPLTMELSRRRAKKNPTSTFHATLSALDKMRKAATGGLNNLGGALVDNDALRTTASTANDALRATGASLYDQIAPAIEAAPIAGQAAAVTAQAAGANVASNPVTQVAAMDARAAGGVADRAVDGGLPQPVRDVALPIPTLDGDKFRVGDFTGSAGLTGKGIVRGALVTADVPLELTKAGFRAGAKATYDNALAGSYFNPIRGFVDNLKEHGGNAGIGALASRVEGEEVDLGEGFFPGGEVYKSEQAASESALIRGLSISPGRVVAHAIVDPESKAYDLMSGILDFAFTLTGDPIAGAGAGIARARRAGKLIAVPGSMQGYTPTFNRMLIKSHRNTTMAEQVTDFFQTSKQGTKFVEWATDANAADVWRALGRRIDPELAIRLGDTTDAKLVEEILIEAGGGKLRLKPEVPKEWRGETIRNARLLSDMPGRKIEFQGPGMRLNARTAEDYLKNAGITSQATIDEVVDSMLRASLDDADVADRYGAVTLLMDKVSEALVAKIAPNSKYSGEMLKRMTQLWSDDVSLSGRYNVDALGNNAHFPGVKIGPDNLPAANPHLIVEGLNHSVALPDPRAIRRLTSKYRNILTRSDSDKFGDLRMPFAALDHLMNDIWKPMQLLRVAWPVRVLGEQQFRLAAAGYENPLTSPLSYLAAVIADDGFIGKMLPDAAKGRRHTDALGELFVNRDKFVPFATEIQRAANTHQDFYNRAMRSRFQGRDLISKGEGSTFRVGWADEQAQLSVDPLAQRLLAGTLFKGDVIPAAEGTAINRQGTDAIKEWFFHSDYRQQVIRMQTLNPGESIDDLASRVGSDAYVDSILERIEVKTGGNPKLREALRSGELDGAPMFAKDGKINPKYRDKLKDYIDVAPDKVKTPAFFTEDDGNQRVTRMLFSALMGVPDRKLFRNPMFREVYWKRMEELAPSLTAEAQAKLQVAATKAKLSKEEVRNLARATSQGTGKLSIEEGSLLAKGGALDEVHDLLYDLSRRGQWADGLRLIVPFGEAWKEVLTTWARLGTENPNVVRRVQTTIESGRRSGFFFPDPVSGEESFGFPLTEGMNKLLPFIGMPIGFTGELKGLNFAAQIIPGIGPVGAWPMSFIVDHMPGGEFFSNILFPYGEPDVSLGDPGSLAEAFLPPWMRKTAAGADQEELMENYASSIQHVGEYLASTGRYDFTDRDDRVQWEQDSASKAGWLTFIRGLSQMILPTAPKPNWTVETKEQLKTVAFLRDEMVRLEKDFGRDEAPRELLKKYGDDVFLLLSPMSRGSAPAKTATAEWAREHPRFRAKYRDVYGYFAPAPNEGPGSELDMDFYGDQMDTKERERFNLPERVVEAHRRIGFSWWAYAQDKVKDRRDKAAAGWLNGVRAALMDEYPGWSAAPGDLGRLPAQIQDVLKASKDRAVKSSPVAKAIQEYAGYREMVRKQMDPKKPELSTAGKWEPSRRWLFQWGQEISRKTPEFRRVWEQLLSRELALDEEE